MKLIDEWKSAHKFFSVQIGALGSFALVGWVALPAEQQHALLQLFGLDVPAVLAITGIAVAVGSRLVKQGPAAPPSD